MQSIAATSFFRVFMYGVVKKTESVLGMSFAIGLFNAAKPAHLMQKWIAKKKRIAFARNPFFFE